MAIFYNPLNYFLYFSATSGSLKNIRNRVNYYNMFNYHTLIRSLVRFYSLKAFGLILITFYCLIVSIFFQKQYLTTCSNAWQFVLPIRYFVIDYRFSRFVPFCSDWPDWLGYILTITQPRLHLSLMLQLNL